MFKAGDAVIVRHHTQEEKDLYPNGWNPLMDKLEGNVYHINEIRKDGHIIINKDGHRWILVSSSLQIPYDQF